MKTDLDKIYAYSRAMANHAHEAIYHLAVFQTLCKRALSVVCERLDPETGAIEQHPDLDQRTLVEVALFPAFWKEAIAPLVALTTGLEETLESAIADMVPISADPLKGDWETTAYPIFWREASLRMMRRRYPQTPLRKLFADILHAPEEDTKTTRLYQSEAFRDKKDDAGDDDDSPNGTD